MRRLVREHGVTTDDLLYPMFVTEERESREIPSMPGVFRYTLDDLCRAVEKWPAWTSCHHAVRHPRREG